MQKTSPPEGLVGPDEGDAVAPLTRGRRDENLPSEEEITKLLAAAEADADAVFPGVPLS